MPTGQLSEGNGLSLYNPLWDQTRANSGNDYVFSGQRIVLATDFECGNGYNLRCDGGRYIVDLEPEPGNHRFSGKSYYFCCGLRNLTASDLSVVLQLRANMNGDFGVGTRSVTLRINGEWSHLEPQRIHSVPGEDIVDLDIDIPANGTPVFVSNFHWHPHSELVAWVEELRDQPRARVSELGRSTQGRPLFRIDIGRDDPNAPSIVISQTPQPSEGVGVHICRALVDYLISDDPAATGIRAAQRVIIVPASNPDGSVVGYGVSHPSGRFPYFEGRLTTEGCPNALPEMQALWHLLAAERPWWFIECHGNNWDRRPGCMLLRYRPRLLANPIHRVLWEDIDEQLLSLEDTHHGNWTDHDEGLYQDTLGFQAVTRLGSIAHMIKHHDKFPLSQSRRLAIAYLRCGCKTYHASNAEAVWSKKRAP